ncbi:hypothetical protein QVD17_10733 [Tagetes erecta]|uniref:Uncharacterized protein n=1 Tax=Tagetes erecta TaxID=13708 RepID=A0AAD8P6L0_TARER|nr:hypothetical protein QVD17_10733 [Tagetes erecta]
MKYQAMRRIMKKLYNKKHKIITMGDKKLLFSHGLSKKLKLQSANGMVFTTPTNSSDDNDNRTNPRVKMLNSINANLINNFDPISSSSWGLFANRKFHRLVYMNPYCAAITGARHDPKTHKAYNEYLLNFLRVSIHHAFVPGEEDVIEEESSDDDDEEDELSESEDEEYKSFVQDEKEKAGAQIHLITKNAELYDFWNMKELEKIINEEQDAAITDGMHHQPFLDALPSLKFVSSDFIDLSVDKEKKKGKKKKKKKKKKEKQHGDNHVYHVHRWRVNKA